MIDKLALVLEAKELERKSSELTLTRSIAAGKWQVAEQEFESLLQQDAASAEKVESARQNLMSLYEQFIDSCLAFRTHNNTAISRLEQIMKEIKNDRS